MNLAALSPAAVRNVATSALPPKVGELSARFHKDEDLYLGQPASAESYSSLQDAISGAAGLSHHSGAAFAVTRGRGGYQARELLQPVWTRSGLGRENANSLDRVTIQPLGGSASNPQFGFFKLSADRYGGQFRDERTGTIQIDPSSAVEAVVGNDWAVVDGRFQSVTPSFPPAPQPPLPPVDPRPPVDPNPPVDPTRPPAPGARTLVEDLTEGLRLATEAARIITTVSPTDRGEESSKDVRIKAYKTNMAAQARLERQFTGNTPEVLSTLRKADASLEDANWQLAKKPSPDGRFNGVDVPGALRDTRVAVDLLGTLLKSLTGGAAAA